MPFVFLHKIVEKLTSLNACGADYEVTSIGRSCKLLHFYCIISGHMSHARARQCLTVAFHVNASPPHLYTVPSFSQVVPMCTPM